MSRLNVPPTKSVQLNLRRDLDMATEGHALLEQKREILVMELMHLLRRVKEVSAELEKQRSEAYGTLRRAIALNGNLHLHNVASGIHYEHRIELSTRLVAGFHTPALIAETEKFHSQYGLIDTDAAVDQTMQEFLKLLESVTRLAELETTVVVLARELKKTQRRVNALEHLFIPDYRETLRYISDSLESSELDSFFTNKMIKKKLGAGRNSSGSGEDTASSEEEEDNA